MRIEFSEDDLMKEYPTLKRAHDDMIRVGEVYLQAPTGHTLEDFKYAETKYNNLLHAAEVVTDD